MLPLQVEEKLQMFRKEKYVVLAEKEEKELGEKSRSGEVRLRFIATGDTLILLSPERNVLPYLDEKQKGATSCADVFIYRLRKDTSVWDLHIIEFKKTINTDSLGKSKWQFTMGIYNARAVAAFLGMELQKKNGICELELDGGSKVVFHHKIQLKQDGTGVLCI